MKTAAVESVCLLGDTGSSVVRLGLSQVQPLSLTISPRRVTTRLFERALRMPPCLRGTRLRRRRQVLKRRQLKRMLLHNRIVHRIDA